MGVAGSTGTERRRARCRERLLLLAGARGGQLIRDAGEELRQTIGFDEWCWVTADPSSSLPTAHMASPEIPFANAAPRLVASTQAYAAPRRAHWSPPRAMSMSLLTGGDYARDRLWRECLGPYGTGDQLWVGCADRNGTWGQLIAARMSDSQPFQPEDVRLLDAVSASLGAILRADVARVADHPVKPVPPPGVLILDGQLGLVSSTASARSWLGVFPDSQIAAGWRQLPASVYAAAGRVHHHSDPERAGLPAHGRIATIDGTWAVLEGQPLDGAGTGQVAITIRAATTHELLDLRCRAHAFTRRETQLAELLIDGLNTNQIAARLYISPHTVKDHLKAIFTKTATRTRGEVTAHLAGLRTDHQHPDQPGNGNGKP